MVKTFERVVDPLQTTKIDKELFDVKYLLNKIPKNRSYLEIVCKGFKQLKNTWKYSIKDENQKDPESKPQDEDPKEKVVEAFMKSEGDNIKKLKKKTQQFTELKNWKKISVNKDIHG